MGPLRKWLFAGLLVVLPVAITAWVIQWIVGTLDQTLLILPVAWHPDRLFGIHIPGLGVVLALGILLLVGAVTSNFIGRRLLSWSDRVFNRIPVVRSIYSGVKQVSDSLLATDGQSFRQAVMLEFPQPGIWSIGFVTGRPAGEVAGHLPGDTVGVFIPLTPNPTAGHFILVPAGQVIELEMSVEEALKYIISMGMVPPRPASALRADAGPPAA